MSEELKPCPFCGKPATLRKRIGLVAIRFRAGCEGCAVIAFCDKDTEQEAISAWNNRKQGDTK